MQIKRNPWLRLLYLTLLLPLVCGALAIQLAHRALLSAGWEDRIIELVLALLAGGLAVKCWSVTYEFARDMRRFLETLQAIKRGELVWRSERAAELPEIEELARELSGTDESPDTSLAKWILLSRDHQAIFVRLVEAVSASIHTKSFYARGHSGRVAEYSTLICREMDLPEQESTRIRLAALLHDIGKIGMDQNILTKPGVLTAAEFAVLQTHPTRGAEMLRPVAEFVDLLPGLEMHHESLDGVGYPRGLKGDEIPLMARIIAVADTFDAMTHNRTYQDAMDGPYALRIIRSMAGRKFDHRAVDAFCRAYAAGRVVLPRRDDSEDAQEQAPAHSADVLAVPANIQPADVADPPSLVTVARD
jgi:HD-GYP domain-containing protein (c-di-GMP phosphodiesterase class II)